ncbi:amidohydrolase family protein [Cupriavidus sp. PET2-C1]
MRTLAMTVAATCALLTAACSSIQTAGTTQKSESVAPQGKSNPKYADAHFHTSNYAYQGISLKQLIHDYMKDDIVRSVVMPVPLQQRWDGFENYAAGQIAPNYYLGPKADLYYYSFADAMYAKEYRSLSKEEQQRIDLMITGFNPMDKYAPFHIKRALLTFPGTFVGIGEFTVHKEIVSKKVAGEPISRTSAVGLPADADSDDKLSLYNPALVDILNLLSETGLVGTLHNDIYPADVRPDGTVEALHPEKSYETALRNLCAKNPKATVIWAHAGLGRFVKPTREHVSIVSGILDACPAWYVDISWDLAQEWMIHPREGMPSADEWVAFIDRYQDRILWGSDTVAYSRNIVDSSGTVKASGRRMPVEEYEAVPKLTVPMFDRLKPEVAQKVRIGNYVRLFDAARARVRTWEAQHGDDDVWNFSTAVVEKAHSHAH